MNQTPASATVSKASTLNEETENSHRPSSAGGVFSGLRIVSLCTLLSRILGLVRDVGMAALFGNGVIMDAFTVAFRIPNLARRFFGEGALTAAFLPVFVGEMERHGRSAAWKIGSAVLVLLGLSLCGVVLVTEVDSLGAFDLGGCEPGVGTPHSLNRPDDALSDFDLSLRSDECHAARVGAFHLAGFGSGLAERDLDCGHLVDRPPV